MTLAGAKRPRSSRSNAADSLGCGAATAASAMPAWVGVVSAAPADNSNGACSTDAWPVRPEDFRLLVHHGKVVAQLADALRRPQE